MDQAPDPPRVHVLVGENPRKRLSAHLGRDTCSGAGTYANPDTGEVIAEGSGPILGRAAKTYTEERGPGKTMRVICGSGGIGRRELEEEAACRRAHSSSKTQTEV
jgi:hypothetical protein